MSALARTGALVVGVLLLSADSGEARRTPVAWPGVSSSVSSAAFVAGEDLQFVDTATKQDDLSVALHVRRSGQIPFMVSGESFVNLVGPPGRLHSEPHLRPAAGSALSDPLEVLRADREMLIWLDRHVVAGTPEAERLDRLAEALLGPEFGLEHIGFPEPTPTAAQAFAERRVNCVGFAALFATLARELGEPVYFVHVPQRRAREVWREVQVVEDHLVVAADRGRRVQLYDQTGKLKRVPRSAEPVSDLRLLSIFYSNRAVEELAGGRVGAARDRLQRAVELDPAHPAAWVNLGVVLGRQSDLKGAEHALRRALQLAPSSSGAVRNLSALLVRTGREYEARELALRYARPDPLSTLERAAAHLRQGDLETARRLYVRALAMSQ